jgi:hypothetical protein
VKHKAQKFIEIDRFSHIEVAVFVKKWATIKFIFLIFETPAKRNAAVGRGQLHKKRQEKPSISKNNIICHINRATKKAACKN